MVSRRGRWSAHVRQLAGRSRPARGWRAALGGAAHQGLGALAATAVFVAAAAGSLVLHGDLPSTRRAVAYTVTSLLEPLFSGQLVLRQVDHLGFDGVDLASVDVLDPWGRQVARLEGVHARLGVVGAVERLLVSGGVLQLRLDDVQVDKADIDLDRGPDGRIRIVAAFTPRPAPPGPPAAPRSTPSLRIELPVVRVTHGRIHGEPVEGLPIEASASHVPAAGVVTEQGVEIDVERFALRSTLLRPLNPTGTADYHLRLTDGRSRMWASFHGQVGEVTTDLSARLDGWLLSATADVARAEPEQIRSLVPGLQLAEAAQLHAEVSGTLPDLHGKLLAQTGTAVLDADLDARLVDGLELAATYTARDVDPRLFVPGAPSLKATATGRTRLRLSSTGPQAELEALTGPLFFRGQSVPGAQLTASFDGRRVQGTLRPFEPGVDGSFSFGVDALDASDPLRVEGALKVPSLAAVTRLGGVLEGRADAQIKGQLTRDGTLDLDVRATYGSLAVGALRVDRGSVGARLRGPLDQLRLEASVGAEQVQAGQVAVPRVSILASGAPLSPSLRVGVTDPRWSKLEVTAGLTLLPRPALHRVALRFEGGELSADVRAASVTVDGDAVALRGLDVSGPALAAHGDVRVSPGGFRLDLRDGQLDLAALGRFLAPRVGLPALAAIDDGHLRFEASLDAEGSHRSGSASARLDGLCYQRQAIVVGGDARLVLDDARATATLSAEAVQATCRRPRGEAETLPREVLASTRAQATGTLPGSLLEASTWGAATGEIQLQELLVSLDHLSAHPLVAAVRAVREYQARQAPTPGLGAALDGLPTVGGTVRAEGRITRLSSRGAPSAQLDVRTDRLAIELPHAPLRSLQRVEGLDLRSTFLLRPTTLAGHVDAGIDLSLRQGDLELGELAVAVTPDIDGVFEHLRTLDDERRRGALTAWLRALPWRGMFAWRPVELSELPLALRPRGVRGRLSLDGSISGTLEAPSVVFRGSGSDLHTDHGEGWEQWRLGASVEGSLDERGMVVRGVAQHRAENLAGAEGSATFWATSTRRLGEALRGEPGAWQLDAQATLDRWRLEALPPLAEAGLRGQVSGVAQALRMHVQPVLWLDLRLDDGQVLDAHLGPSTLRASLLEGGGFVTATMTQTNGATAGSVSLTALPTLVFRDRLFPDLDRTHAHTLAVQASHFDIEPLSPLTAPLLADLRGTIDGELSVTVGARPEMNAIAGWLHWQDGVLLIPQLGQTLTAGRFDLVTVPHPELAETRVEVTGLSLSATTGRITGLAGFAIPRDFLARLLFPPADASPAAPLKGQFAAYIAPSDAIPVTFEGLALGDAHGQIDGFLTLDHDGLKVQVAIPDLTFELPESLTQQSVQSLSDDPSVGVVGAPAKRRTGDAATTARPLPIMVIVGLGSRLEELLAGAAPSSTVLIERGGIEVRVNGQLQLAFADEVLAAGTVNAVSGRIIALGKPFDIRPGIVRFEGTATNPFLNVGATWDAPDGTRVFADLLGYLREVQLRLHSEPAQSESQVLSLLLFGGGQSAAAATAPGANPTAAATSSLAVGGGVVSTVLNSLLDPIQIFGRRIEIRVDNSATRGTIYGAATEIRPRLWLQVDVSTTPQRERQNGDLSALTLDWRFRPNWSLRTELGNRGSSLLELLWQFRY